MAKQAKPEYRVVLWSGGKDSTATIILAHEKNTVARGFKYGVPFEEIDRKVTEYIANPPAIQLSLFSYEEV